MAKKPVKTAAKKRDQSKFRKTSLKKIKIKKEKTAWLVSSVENVNNTAFTGDKGHTSTLIRLGATAASNAIRESKAMGFWHYIHGRWLYAH